MSISAVTSNTPIYQPPPPPANGPRQNFQALSQAIQSGDISSAQAAYATLMQNLPSQASSSSGSQNPFQQAISSIGSALQSGDISGAQQALQTMQSQAKGAHHGHHHHGGGSQQVGSTSSPDQSGSSDTSGNISAGIVV